MDLELLNTKIAGIERETAEATQKVTSIDALRSLDSAVLGKTGSLGGLIANIKEFPADQRGQVGKLVNEAKGRIKSVLDARMAELQQAAASASDEESKWFDPTLPGNVRPMGSVHPVTAVQWEIERLFERLGFTVEDGPEMESEYNNFEALNIPASHPARDMQDTFWLANGMVLRTHTSPVQHRSMKKFGAPLRVIAPGRCFRYETIDASHENTFHQVEGLMIDRDIGLPHLIAMAKMLLTEVMQREVTVRVRPGYFPFVEPGIEIDMNCAICGGKKCPTCKYSGWVEILPAGMVHPNVLRAGGIDPDEWSGFAFGLGLTRLAMMKYGIGDIRILNSGDLRALVAPQRMGGPIIVDKTTKSRAVSEPRP
ncbi:MAG: phenylalanine--tRNA ligase subunit alpha [Planctomycetes bacterium]|nr:phenylalanine--tRNA ligase subunit alpha [Planctomycetota bacterium]MBI3835064.1 phenylalanine--tRNA ligase subunit alpha [Planctomycetota bacterium]